MYILLQGEFSHIQEDQPAGCQGVWSDLDLQTGVGTSPEPAK